MPFWTRKLPEREKHPAATPDQNRSSSRFLQLPGELRNLIYSYAIYPQIDSILIVQGKKKCDFGKTVLNLSIFRTSHQIRAEALSYLCASKHLQVCAIDAAVAFFDCLGDATSDVKRLTVAQMFAKDKPLPLEQIDKLFHFLDQATSLRFLKIEVGRIGDPFTWKKEVIGKDWVFLERISGFVKERKEVDFQWTAGAYDSKAPMYGGAASRSIEIRELFGHDAEAVNHQGVMYMW